MSELLRLFLAGLLGVVCSWLAGLVLVLVQAERVQADPLEE